MNNAPTFQRFWDAYGLKRDRFAAERAWNRLSATDKRKAIFAIPDYNADCARRGINRMYAQGYLNHHRWEDDFADDMNVAQNNASAPVADDAPMKSW